MMGLGLEGLVCGYVERIRAFLDRLDYIWGFKKVWKSRMRLVRWRAQIEGYSGIYTYADSQRKERHHCVIFSGWESSELGVRLECPASSSADRTWEQINKVRHALWCDL